MRLRPRLPLPQLLLAAQLSLLAACSGADLEIRLFFPDQVTRGATSRLVLMAVKAEPPHSCGTILGLEKTALGDAVLAYSSTNLLPTTTQLTFPDVPLQRMLLSALAYDQSSNKAFLAGCTQVDSSEASLVELDLRCAPGVPQVNGTCCVPSCSGACGASDGCGGSCQTGTCSIVGATCKLGTCECSSGVSCSSTCCPGAKYVCAATGSCCRPSCGTRVCGPDPACNAPQACGSCPTGKTCDAQGTCVDEISWTAVQAPSSVDLRAIWGSSASKIWAVGATGTIVRYSGSAWTSVSSGVGADLHGLAGAGSSSIWAVGAGGTVLRYSGSSWIVEASGANQDLHAAWVSTTGEVYAAGAAGTILRRTTASGWGPETSGSTKDLHGIWGAGAAAVHAVGGGGTILRLSSGFWVKQSASSGYTYNAVWGSGALVRAVSSKGVIRRYNGSSWSNESTGTSQPLHAIWGSSNSDIWVVGANGTVRHYNGSKWAQEQPGTSTNLRGVWGTAGGDLWVVGDSGTILRRGKAL